MSQDDLISPGIEGNYGWCFLGEIRIGNVDNRPEGIISEIGMKTTGFTFVLTLRA